MRSEHPLSLLRDGKAGYALRAHVRAKSLPARDFLPYVLLDKVTCKFSTDGR